MGLASNRYYDDGATFHSDGIQITPNLTGWRAFQRHYYIVRYDIHLVRYRQQSEWKTSKFTVLEYT